MATLRYPANEPLADTWENGPGSIRLFIQFRLAKDARITGLSAWADGRANHSRVKPNSGTKMSAIEDEARIAWSEIVRRDHLVSMAGCSAKREQRRSDDLPPAADRSCARRRGIPRLRSQDLRSPPRTGTGCSAVLDEPGREAAEEGMETEVCR